MLHCLFLALYHLAEHVSLLLFVFNRCIYFFLFTFAAAAAAAAVASASAAAFLLFYFYFSLLFFGTVQLCVAVI